MDDNGSIAGCDDINTENYMVTTMVNTKFDIESQ